jgi:hypothetical protein
MKKPARQQDPNMVDIAVFGLTQRSGSTLVQRLFNANPQTLMWGENGRVMGFLQDGNANAAVFSEFHAAERSLFFRENRPVDLNISCMSPELATIHNAAIAGTRALFTAMYPRGEYQRVGFKEVFHSTAAVALFQEAFPDATIVLLARHPVPTWRSTNPEWLSLEEFIERWTADLVGYASLGPILWYERLLGDPSTQDEFRELAGITRQQFESVMSVKVASSADDFPKPASDYELINARCGHLIPADIMLAGQLSRDAA